MSTEQKWINQNSLDNKDHIYFIEMNNQCALCGGELTLSIQASEDKLVLTEKAHHHRLSQFILICKITLQTH